MDGLNNENNAESNAFTGGRSDERPTNQKPMAKSVAMKLNKLRARLAKKEMQEKAFSTPPPAEDPFDP
jgi:hypothetical protein